VSENALVTHVSWQRLLGNMTKKPWGFWSTQQRSRVEFHSFVGQDAQDCVRKVEKHCWFRSKELGFMVDISRLNGV